MVKDSANGSYWRYANDVTIENCTFTATAGSAAENLIVGVRFQQAYNIKVVNCTATNLHSLAQFQSIDNTISVEDCKVVNGKNGVSFGNTANATIKNTEIAAVGYGVRADGDKNRGNLIAENVKISAPKPIIVRKVTSTTTAYNLTLAGDNTLTTSELYDVVFTNGNDEAEFAKPTGKYTLTGAEGFKVYPRDYIDLSQTITGEINAEGTAITVGASVTEDELGTFEIELMVRHNL